MDTQESTLVFIFNPNLDKVWLIKKESPEWQRGLLNGLGGKTEGEESPIDCAIRELQEESGLIKKDLVEVGSMVGIGWRTTIYTGVTSETLETRDEGEVKLYDLDAYKHYPHIENLTLLIEAALLKIKSVDNVGDYMMDFYLQYP